MTEAFQAGWLLQLAREDTAAFRDAITALCALERARGAEDEVKKLNCTKYPPEGCLEYMRQRERTPEFALTAFTHYACRNCKAQKQAKAATAAALARWKEITGNE